MNISKIADILDRHGKCQNITKEELRMVRDYLAELSDMLKPLGDQYNLFKIDIITRKENLDHALNS